MSTPEWVKFNTGNSDAYCVNTDLCNNDIDLTLDVSYYSLTKNLLNIYCIYLQSRNGDTDIENKRMGTNRGEGGWINWD